MKIHITNLYNFIPKDPLVSLHHRFAEAGRKLGFLEMGIFSYPVETDTPGELSKRLDGIIAALESEDVVFMQLPTGNGLRYEQQLFDKIKAYKNTKIILLIHSVNAIRSQEYITLCKRADALILPTLQDGAQFQGVGITNLLFCDDIHYSDRLSNSVDRNFINSSVPQDCQGYLALCQTDFYVTKLLMDAINLLFKPQATQMQSLVSSSQEEIHIGFGLHDKTGNYSVWVGVAMQSIIEHTNSKICFHVLIDETVSPLNKNRLTQVAANGGHHIRFHLIDGGTFAHLQEQVSHFTIGTMFRIMLPELLPELSKIIYLDADILVNRDIRELWDINIDSYALAAVPDAGAVRKRAFPLPVLRNEVPAEHYFNSGVLLMNLECIRKFGNMKEDVLAYLNKTKESYFPDQDAMNAIFSHNTLFLDETWNYFALLVCEKNEKLKSVLYHYAGSRPYLHSLTEMDQLCFETVSRTPWGQEACHSMITSALGRMADRTKQLEKLLGQISSHKKYIFYGEETPAMKNMYNILNVREGDYRISSEPVGENNGILPCNAFSVLEEETDEFVVFVLPEADQGNAIHRLEQMGLVNEKDFFVIPRLLDTKRGGYI